jgi:hypothetical protein
MTFWSVDPWWVRGSFYPRHNVCNARIRGFIDAHFNFLRSQRLDGKPAESKI